MNHDKTFGLPVIPLYYSIPLLVVCITALLILIFAFGVEVPVVLFTPPVGAVNVTSCGTLGVNGTYYYLSTNLNFPGATCFIITGDNIVLDGENLQNLTGDNSAGTAAVIVLGKNVTVKGLNIYSADRGILVNGVPNATITLNYINNSASHAVHLNFSNESKVIQNVLSYPGRDGVLFDLSFNGLVQDNIISGREGLPTPGTSAAGIEMNNSVQNSILNNSIFNFAKGVSLQYSKGNVFTRNLIISPSFNGIYLLLNNGTANYFDSNRIIGSQRSAIFVDKTVSVIFLNLSVVNTVSPYYDLETASMPNGVQLFDTYLGKYIFNSTNAVFRSTGNSWINFTQGLNGTGSNLSADVRLGFNYVDVNSVQRPELNKGAIITFQGLSTNLVSPIVYRSGQACPLSVCVNLSTPSAGIFVFSVTGWTNYSIGSSSVAPPQMITINEPDPNDVYSQSNFPVNFDVDLNQTGRAWFSLNSGSSNTTMNSDDNISFNYLQSALSAANYTFTVYANFTGTTQKASAFVNFRVTNSTGSFPPIPMLIIDEPDANEIYYLNSFPVNFIVNLSQSGKAWFSLNSGASNVTMVGSLGGKYFVYSQSAISVGNYTFTAYANFTGTVQRDTESVSFRVLSNSSVPFPNNTIILNNTNSSNLPPVWGAVEFKYVAYWLVVSVLSIAIVILILLIIKYFRTREVERNTIPRSIVSQLR